jgi:purine-nucleoside phosphorylase
LADESRIAEAAAYLRGAVPSRAHLGLVLGSGLGGVRKAFRTVRAFPYGTIPHFPVSTVHGHRGELAFAVRDKVHVWIMDGRVHLYEGHDFLRVTFPVRVLARLGMTALIVTNAAGGVSKKLSPGDIMLIEDHINLMWNVVPEVGGRPSPRHSPYYSKRMIDAAEDLAGRMEVRALRGVLLAGTGPAYETRAEVEFARQIGADAVTMSTIPEVTACYRLGVTVVGMSLITNMAAQPKGGHEDVLISARQGSKNLEKMILALAGRIREEA